MSNAVDRWVGDVIKDHADQVRLGLHDDACEWRPRYWMCHCSKRRRIAAGFIEPPGPLEHRMPDCPRCGREVDHDGDAFRCYGCAVSWSPSDPEDPGEFTDDHGTLNPPPRD